MLDLLIPCIKLLKQTSEILDGSNCRNLNTEAISSIGLFTKSSNLILYRELDGNALLFLSKDLERIENKFNE